MTVVVRVRVRAGGDDSPFERYPGKEAFAPAVSVYRGLWSYIRLTRSSHRSRGHARIGTERDISATRKRADGGVVIEDDYEIGHLRADLKTPTCAARSDKRGARPAVCCPRNHYAFTSFAAEDKAGFDHAEDGKTFGVPDNIPRKALFRHVPELPNGCGAAVNDILFGRGGSCHSETKDNES